MLPNESWHRAPAAPAEAVAVLVPAPQLGTGLASEENVLTLTKTGGSEVVVESPPGEDDGTLTLEDADAAEETEGVLEGDWAPEEVEAASEEDCETELLCELLEVEEVEFCEALAESEVDKLEAIEDDVCTTVLI